MTTKDTAQAMTDDAIARSKRILELVDIYVERPDRMNRNALRGHLFDEFTEAATTAQPSQAQTGAAVYLAQIAALETAVCNGQSGEALRLLHHMRNALASPVASNEGYSWLEDVCTRDHGEYKEDAALKDRLRWWVPRSARHGTTVLEDDLREAAERVESNEREGLDEKTLQEIVSSRGRAEGSLWKFDALGISLLVNDVARALLTARTGDSHE